MHHVVCFHDITELFIALYCHALNYNCQLCFQTPFHYKMQLLYTLYLIESILYIWKITLLQPPDRRPKLSRQGKSYNVAVKGTLTSDPSVM